MLEDFHVSMCLLYRSREPYKGLLDWSFREVFKSVLKITFRGSLRGCSRTRFKGRPQGRGAFPRLHALHKV